MAALKQGQRVSGEKLVELKNVEARAELFKKTPPRPLIVG